jgi:ribonuclease G
MKSELLINVTPFETRVALVLDGLLHELQIARASGGSLTGNIYLGRVERIMPGMQAAFVEIGLERPGFLHVRDIARGSTGVMPPFGSGSAGGVDAREPDIVELLHEGQQVLVQISKDPIGGKGARLSTDLALASRYVVVMPFDSHIGVSQRIEDPEERDRLRNAIEEIRNRQDAPLGVIARTVADGAPAAQLEMDLAYLVRVWQRVCQRRAATRAPALVYEELPIQIRAMRDIVTTDVEAITIDDDQTYERMRRFVDEFSPDFSDRVHRHAEHRPLFERYGIEDEIHRALDAKVMLRCGGSLVIEQTEAMVTIDVNTGGNLGSRTLEDTVFRTNLEAAQVIPRQLRLRNLGGIIVIDFIDMHEEEHRRQVLRTLEKACEGDAARPRIEGFSAFGLVQMSRKRTRESLVRQMCEPCGSCAGTGQVKTAESACVEILRSLMYHARQNPNVARHSDFVVRASQAVIDRLLDEDAPLLASLASGIERAVRLQVEPCYAPGQFDLVCVPATPPIA